MHPLIQYSKDSFPIACGTACVIVISIIVISAIYKKVSEIKVEAQLKVQIMSETIDELILDHDEELLFEKRIAAAHVIKMRMQKRDFSSKLGGLQRKLRKQNETLTSMNSKLVSLEFVEEDANELVDEVMAVREQLKEKNEIIESLRKQLRYHELKNIDSGKPARKTLEENGKENFI